MEENERKPSEQEILELLASFEEELQLKLKETNGEVEKISYYEVFNIKGVKELEVSGVFISEEKDAEGNTSYHAYCRQSSNEIFSVDKDGNISMNPAWEEVIGEIDNERTMGIDEKDRGDFKGVSEKVKDRDISKDLSKRKEKDENENEDKKDQIEEDIKEEGQEDLKITSYRKIKDPNINIQLKGILDKSVDEVGVAYSESLNSFILVAKTNGKFEKVEGVEPSKPTMKSVISINEDGSEVENKVPHALMKTKNPKKELSITIGQYGYVETATVDKLPCNKRVEMQLRQQGEGIEGERSKYLRELETKSKKEEIHDMAHEYEKEMDQRESVEGEESATNADELRDEKREGIDDTVYSPDEERIIEEEAEKDKVSVEEFKRHMEKSDGTTFEEKIEDSHEQIENEYRGKNDNIN